MSMTKKTSAEIKARIEAVKGGDWIGTQQIDLVNYLPFKDAKTFCKPGLTAKLWNERAVKPPLDEVRDYLFFAWIQANSCRGLSAIRSLDHLKAWLWLAGFDEIVDKHFSTYERYGKFQLVIASELTGFNWSIEDNGDWVNDEHSPSLSKAAISKLVDTARKIAKQAQTVAA